MYHVRRLDLFGPALHSNFDAASSDMDLLVEFIDHPAGAADRFFDLRQALEAEFPRPVNLAVHSAVRTPYFLRAIERERANVDGA